MVVVVVVVVVVEESADVPDNVVVEEIDVVVGVVLDIAAAVD